MGFKTFGKKVAGATGRTARFLFIAPMSRAVGAKELGAGFRYLGDLWCAVIGLTCPRCHNALLKRQQQTNIVNEPQTPGASTTPLYVWRCDTCHHFLYAGPGRLSAGKVARGQLFETQRARALDISAEARAEAVLRWRAYSRKWYWLTAVPLFGGALLVFWVGIGNVFFIPYWAICTAYPFLLGMKGAYRYWQARTGTLFQPWSFWSWFMREAWFV